MWNTCSRFLSCAYDVGYFVCICHGGIWWVSGCRCRDVVELLRCSAVFRCDCWPVCCTSVCYGL